MKLNIKHLPVIGLLGLAALSVGSCTDEVAFGDKFLEKAPGGTNTADSIFHNPEYTRGYLARIYSRQYFNLMESSSNTCPQHLNYWKGMPDMLTDLHFTVFAKSLLFTAYYGGMLTSTADQYGNHTVYPYNNEGIWENVRACWLIIERINEVPNMDQDEKDRIRDEAKCLLAAQYFTAFRFFGGMPIIKGTFSGTESSYEGRKSAQETLDFMLGLLDEVIEAKKLPWGYTGAAAASETGHWTLAGAMAQKIQILQFAASPLMNSEAPYYEGKYTMAHPEYVWLGYDKTRWTALRKACEDFITALNANGVYHLVVPVENTQEGYRYAYRQAYMYQDSPEILHSVRTANKAHGNDYGWYNLGWGGAADGGGTNERCAPNPTQEYAEMFPWADGTPFDWDKTAAEGKLDEMFVKGDRVPGQKMLQNRVYTRDPRMYETMGVNGALMGLDYSSGTSSGANWEAWVGGSDASQQPATNTGVWATGYRNLKYVGGEFFRRKNPQWSWLQLSDVYLTYAEAILQDGGSLTDAISYVDQVRARVGLKGLAECNPDKNLTTNKKNLLEEILRERACEFALQCTRYYDMVRYKRADLFERKLHGLRIYRLNANGERTETPWYDTEQSSIDNENDERFYEPNKFEYEKFEITTGARIWWTDGFDCKWFLQPFPLSEVNKGYGLDQNPGW